MKVLRLSISPIAAIACVLALASSACQPQVARRCSVEYWFGSFVMVENRPGADERVISAMTAFANANRLEHEANRYPRGVPGNPHAQFLVSACNQHFHALAQNPETRFIVIEMLGDRQSTATGQNPMAIRLARQLRREFSDAHLSGDLSSVIDDEGRTRTTAEVAADVARSDETDRQLLVGR
jgi:hypothetical protein